MVNPDLPLLVVELYPESNVRRQGFRFLLRQSRHDRNENLALGIEGIYIFLLKENWYILFLQLPDIYFRLSSVLGAKWLVSIYHHLYIILRKLEKEPRITPKLFKNHYKIQYSKDYIAPICFANFGLERWVYAGLGIFHFLFTRFCVGRVFLSFNFPIKAGNFQNW